MTRRAFMTDTRACWVNRDERGSASTRCVTVAPAGPERGFAPSPNAETRTLETRATAEVVGRAVLAALGSAA